MSGPLFEKDRLHALLEEVIVQLRSVGGYRGQQGRQDTDKPSRVHREYSIRLGGAGDSPGDSPAPPSEVQSPVQLDLARAADGRGLPEVGAVDAGRANREPDVVRQVEELHAIVTGSKRQRRSRPPRGQRADLPFSCFRWELADAIENGLFEVHRF